MDEEEVREIPHKLMELVGEVVTNIIAWIFFVAAVTAIVFGLISWCVLKKFRTFRNYTVISALLANALFSLVVELSDRYISEEDIERNQALRIIPLAFFFFFQPAYQYWLIVLCYVFSVDFVKVFHYEGSRKYLWGNLFAWGLPFLTVLIYMIIGSVLINKEDPIDIFEVLYLIILLIIPVAVSITTYLVVVIALFSSSNRNNLCGRFTIATIIFAMSNIILLAMPEMLGNNNLVRDVIGEILEYATTIALIVFIVVLKSNWKLWRDYFDNTSTPETGLMLGDQRI